VSTNRCAKKTTRIIRSAGLSAPTHYIARVLAPRCNNKIGDEVWLNAENVKTERPAKKLDDKFKGPFPVTEVGTHTVKLKLPKTWKISNTFHTD
jgi:hypothetical protein